MKIAFNPSTVTALTTPPNNKDITFDLRGRNIFARGVKFYGTDTNTWRDIKINNVSIGSNILDLRNGSNTTLTNTNGVVTINSTWRPVVDNLTSDSTTSSLSAKQGKVLKALIDGKSNSDHNHDGRYVRYYAVTTLDCNNLAAGLTAARISATNAAHTNHSAYLYISDVGTPFQIQIPGSSIPYIYKRYYDSGKWSGWFKLSAGYADSAGSVAWANVTGKPSSYTPSAHTHAWNSLTHSSTTENQAILTNGKANGWKLQTLNIARWDNAANNAHSHANKSVLDGITSALVNSWNTAYNFVSNITGTDTDKVINKWEEIVNFLAGITEDNKLNTLLNSKLSVYELAYNTNVGTIKNNGIYYSTTDASSGTLINSPFNTGFALINMTSYNGGDDLIRSRLAFNAYGEIKVSDDRDQANTVETWYNVLTSKNSGINGSTIKLNGTSITVYSSGTADGRYVKKSGDTMQGVLTIDTTNFGALTIKRNDDANGASIQFRGKSSVYGYIGLNNSTKDKQFLRWSSDTSRIYTILDTSSTYISNGKGVINGTTITQVDNATNSTNSTNARKLVNWYSARPTSLNAQFGDGSLRIFYATSSTTEGKPAEDSHILHLAWDNNTGGYDAQLAVHVCSGKVSTRAQNGGTWQPWKTLAFITDIPTSLKNPHALTISLNGTSQGPYDGSAAKNINITPGSIGAAVSNHSHDYLVVNSADDKSFNSAYHNFQVLYAGGGNGITGKPANVDAFGLFKFRAASGCSGQMLLANGGSLYIRSSEDAKMTNTLAWKTILDSSNYSGILDSRYYTESEVNSLLNAKLDRQNLSQGTWNPRGYHLAADYQYNGGDLSISENNRKMYVSIDGCFWQNEGQYRVLDTSDIGDIRDSVTLHQYLSAGDAAWYPLVWGGNTHKNTSDSTGLIYKSYDKLSWQTSSQTLYATHLRTTYIDLENNRGISQVTSGGTSPYKGIRLPDLQSNGIGMFSKIGSGDGADEGGIIISADTSVIYNSFDIGWGLTVRDKNRGQTDISGDGTIVFGVRQDYRAYSLGGFEKSGSDNTYVLLGGGDHKLESSLNVAYSKYLTGIAITGGHYNDEGYRLIFEKTMGGWDINYGVWAIAFRHSGRGTLNIGFDTTNSDGSTYIYDIRFLGSIASIRHTPFRAFYNSTTKVFRIYWYHVDYTSGDIAVLRGNMKPHNGTWMTSLPNDVGTELAITYNMADQAANADTVDGYHVNGRNAAPYGHIPSIENDGVMEVGKYIDFHNDNSGKYDFSTRLQTTGNYGNSVYLPSHNGTLALISDNVASATKLATARTIWGQSFDGTDNVSGSLSEVGNIHFKVDNSYDIGSDAAASRYIYTHWLGAKSGSKLELGANNSGYGEGLCIDTNLNVGIGTNTPTQKLDVIGNIRATGQLYLPTNGNYNAILMGNDCWMGDCNISNVIGLSGTNNANSGGIKFGKGGMYIGYNGSSHYSSGTSLWTNFNADTVDGEHASNFSYTHQSSFDFSKRKSGRIVTFDQSGTDYGWINGFASTHNNYLTSVIFNEHRSSNWYVGYMEGDMSTGETNGLQAVHKLAFADGDESCPIFLGYLHLYNGDDGTISSYFSCLGYLVPFTYTRGGTYCLIKIPDTSFQTFYIRAAIASVHYSGAGMGDLVGDHRGDGAWWLYCDVVDSNTVQVKGFHPANRNNDSWWGGNPLYSGNGAAKKITVCLFGYVKFK